MGTAQLEILGKDHIALTGPTSVRNGVAFNLTATLTDGDDSATTDTDYASAVITISATDSDDPQNEITIAYSGDFTITNGVGVKSITLTIPGGTVGPILFSAVTTETENVIKTITGSNYKPSCTETEFKISVPTLVFSAQPSNTERDEDFAYTIQAQDGYGTKMAEITDTITVTLTDAHADDEFINCPTAGDADDVTYDVALVAGEHAQTTQQIHSTSSEDSSDSDVKIVASHASYVNATSDEFEIMSIVTEAVAALDGYAANYATRHATINAAATEFNLSLPQFARYGFFDQSPAFNIARMVVRESSISPAYSSLLINYTKTNTTSGDLNVYLLATETPPTTHGDLLTAEIIETIAVASGANAVVGQFDASALLAGDPSALYIVAVCQHDKLNSGYVSESYKYVKVTITSIVLS